MKYTLLFTFLMIIPCIAIFAQDTNKKKKDIVKDKRIYFFLDESTNQIQYFLSQQGEDASEKISNNDLFFLKGSTTCNFYFKWLNPLKYRVAFKDTTFTAPGDDAIREFVKTYFSALNPAAGSGTSGGTVLKAMREVASLVKLANPTPAAAAKVNSLIIREPFENKDLNLLLLMCRNANITEKDSGNINTMFRILHALEDQYQVDNVSKIKNNFKTLEAITDFNEVTSTVSEVNGYIVNYNRNLTLTNDEQKKLDGLQLTASDDAFRVYSASVIKDYIKVVQDKIESDKLLIEKLGKVLVVMSESVKPKLDSKKEGYFRLKTITFGDDQEMEISFIVSKYELDEAKQEIVNKGNLTTTKLTFEKYDPVNISVSTGLFYSSYTLRGYGVADNFTITEDNINTKTAIPAVFLNFKFDLGSRFFLPILQLGADPTKKRPFILLGGGFAIPTSKFAFTGGPMWTWNQSLKTFAVGDKVNATTDLEKDIKYEFDMRPKGWYMGFQFNF